jgi:hypothetical protein
MGVLLPRVYLMNSGEHVTAPRPTSAPRYRLAA